MVNKMDTTDLDPIVGDKGEILIFNGYFDVKDKDKFHANVEVLEVYSDRQNDIMLCEIKKGYWMDDNGDALDVIDSPDMYITLWCKGKNIVAHSDAEYNVNEAKDYFFNMAETC